MLLVVAACDCSSKPSARDGGVRGDAPPEVGASLELGPEGGVVAIVDPDSPLFGANLVLPADVLRIPTEITLAAAERVPDRSNAIGVGAVLEITPADLPLQRPGTVELPIPDALDPDDFTVARWDELLEEWIPQGGVARSYLDPVARRGGALRLEVSGGGLFRAIYQEPQTVSVLNDGSGTLNVTVGAARYTRLLPVPRPPGELSATIDALEDEPLLLLPGEYVLHALFDGETVPRCERITIVDPVTTVPVEVSFSDFTPSCLLPAVRVTATPDEIEPGGMVNLAATATSTPGSTLMWSWSSTGGAVFGSLMGEAMSAQMINTMWTAPTEPGDYYVSLTAVAADGFFASATARITVATRNQRPEVTSLDASPEVVGPGFPGTFVDMGAPGVTRFRATVSDLDGDPISVFWTHRQPGNWYDIDSGGRLIIDEDTGLVAWTDGRPYTEPEILYQAPEASFVDTLSNGWWMPAAVTASDGEERGRAFRMITVARQVRMMDAGPLPDGGPIRRDAGPRDAGRDSGPPPAVVTGRCLSVADSECEMYVGSAYESQVPALESECTAAGWTWTEGFACPQSGSIGACTRFVGETREVATVYYGSSPTTMQLTMLENDCRMLPVAEGGPGTWMRPYRPPR